MSEQENQNRQTIVRLFDEVVNQGRLEVLDEIAWPDHLEHHPLPGQTQGREGLKQRASMVRAAVNPHFTLEHVLADGDKVAVMWTNRGTHAAEWFGIPATGKTIVTQGVDIFLLRDGGSGEMILVAGGTGRLGTKVVKLLRQRGLEVRVLTRDRTRAAHLVDMGVEIVEGDVGDPAAVQLAVDGTRSVVSAIHGFAGTKNATPATVD